MINNDLRAAMREYGELHYPEEACGFVVQVGKKVRILDSPNAAGDKRNQFRIASEDYVKASDLGEIIGVWHTHCEMPEKPSEADLAGCESSELPWYILSVYKTEQGFSFSEIHAFEPSGFSMDYVGRPYIVGVFDCYSLVVDYYAREFGIKLNSYPRIDNWFRLGMNMFEENFKSEGFGLLLDEEPRAGDVFLIHSGSSIPNHVAIYLGEEKILHHTHGRLSCRDIYGGYWEKHTSHHLRNNLVSSKC